MTRRQHSGFSLMEITIALTIIGIFAAAVTPLALDRVESARKSRALEDLKTIRDAMIAFKMDMGRAPIHRNGNSLDPSCSLTTNCFAWLVSDGGTAPTYADAELNTTYAARIGSLPDQLINNKLVDNPTAYPTWNDSVQRGWNGPYLDKDPIDPWGKKYFFETIGWMKGHATHGVIPIRGFSAGPDKVLNFNAANNTGIEDYGTYSGQPEDEIFLTVGAPVRF